MESILSLAGTDMQVPALRDFVGWTMTMRHGGFFTTTSSDLTSSPSSFILRPQTLLLQASSRPLSLSFLVLLLPVPYMSLSASSPVVQHSSLFLSWYHPELPKYVVSFLVLSLITVFSPILFFSCRSFCIFVASHGQSCEMSQIWQINLCKFFGGLG